MTDVTNAQRADVLRDAAKALRLEVAPESVGGLADLLDAIADCHERHVIGLALVGKAEAVAQGILGGESL